MSLEIKSKVLDSWEFYIRAAKVSGNKITGIKVLKKKVLSLGQVLDVFLKTHFCKQKHMAQETELVG